jgi:hypothetical protein
MILSVSDLGSALGDQRSEKSLSFNLRGISAFFRVGMARQALAISPSQTSPSIASIIAEMPVRGVMTR